MKKILVILLTLALALSFAACGDTGENPSGNNTADSGTEGQETQANTDDWPPISYITDADRYTGDGTIAKVKEWDASGENAMWTIYYEGATFESVESYVVGLMNAGWENHYSDEDGNYMEQESEKGTARAYYLTCDYAEVEIMVADFANSMSFSDEDEFSFNLSIAFLKSE